MAGRFLVLARLISCGRRGLAFRLFAHARACWGGFTVEVVFFILAILVVGWSLSLITYRLVARLLSWPMGTAQREHPLFTAGVGFLSLAVGLAVAVLYSDEMFGGWFTVISGVAMGIFWTGFLRVGSQTSLFLAPAGALVLLIWVAVSAFPS